MAAPILVENDPSVLRLCHTQAELRMNRTTVAKREPVGPRMGVSKDGENGGEQHDRIRARGRIERRVALGVRDQDRQRQAKKPGMGRTCATSFVGWS